MRFRLVIGTSSKICKAARTMKSALSVIALPAARMRPWWLWPNVLSLDATVVALVWQAAFAHWAGHNVGCWRCASGWRIAAIGCWTRGDCRRGRWIPRGMPSRATTRGPWRRRGAWAWRWRRRWRCKCPRAKCWRARACSRWLAFIFYCTIGKPPASGRAAGRNRWRGWPSRWARFFLWR